MWEDRNYCWIVLWKNHLYHLMHNFLFKHRIPLGFADAYMSAPPRLTKRAGTAVNRNNPSDNSYIRATSQTLQKCELALMNEHWKVEAMKAVIVNTPIPEDTIELQGMPDWFCQRMLRLGYDWSEGCR